MRINASDKDLPVKALSKLTCTRLYYYKQGSVGSALRFKCALMYRKYPQHCERDIWMLPQSISLGDTWYIPVKEMTFLVVLSNNSIWKVGSLRHLFVNVAAVQTQWRGLVSGQRLTFCRNFYRRNFFVQSCSKFTVDFLWKYSNFSFLTFPACF